MATYNPADEYEDCYRVNPKLLIDPAKFYDKPMPKASWLRRTVLLWQYKFWMWRKGF